MVLCGTVNRRLDEWVKLEQLDLDTMETELDEKVDDKVCFHLLFISFSVSIMDASIINIPCFDVLASIEILNLLGSRD